MLAARGRPTFHILPMLLDAEAQRVLNMRIAPPDWQVNFDKLAEGELEMNPDLGVNYDKLANLCPPKTKKSLEAIFGEKFLTSGDAMSDGGLLKALVDTTKQSSELMSKSNEVIEAVQKASSNPSEIVTQAKDSGMDPMSAMKVPGKVRLSALCYVRLRALSRVRTRSWHTYKHVASRPSIDEQVARNSKTAMSAPRLLTELFKTIKDVAQEVQTGMQGATGAVADAS